MLKLVGIMQELTGFNESSLAQTQFEGQAEATQLFGSVDLFGSVWVSVLTDWEHFLDSMDSGAWPFLVGGVILKLIFALKVHMYWKNARSTTNHIVLLTECITSLNDLLMGSPLVLCVSKNNLLMP